MELSTPWGVFNVYGKSPRGPYLVFEGQIAAGVNSGIYGTNSLSFVMFDLMFRADTKRNRWAPWIFPTAILSAPKENRLGTIPKRNTP